MARRGWLRVGVGHPDHTRALVDAEQLLGRKGWAALHEVVSIIMTWPKMVRILIPIRSSHYGPPSAPGHNAAEVVSRRCLADPFRQVTLPQSDGFQRRTRIPA